MSKLLGLGSQHNESEQDFELNIASIIDCFTVLIAYMLMAASFISIGMFDVSVPAMGAATTASNPPPKITLMVKLKQNGSIQVKATGAKSMSSFFAAKDGKWDFEALGSQVKELKERWSNLDTAMVAADPLVEYRPVVQGIDQVRKHLPNVFIGEK